MDRATLEAIVTIAAEMFYGPSVNIEPTDDLIEDLNEALDQSRNAPNFFANEPGGVARVLARKLPAIFLSPTMTEAFQNRDDRAMNDYDTLADRLDAVID